MLSCLSDGAYKRYVDAMRKISPYSDSTRFLLSLSVVLNISDTTWLYIKQMCWVHHWKPPFLSFLHSVQWLRAHWKRENEWTNEWLFNDTPAQRAHWKRENEWTNEWLFNDTPAQRAHWKRENEWTNEWLFNDTPAQRAHSAAWQPVS